MSDVRGKPGANRDVLAGMLMSWIEGQRLLLRVSPFSHLKTAPNYADTSKTIGTASRLPHILHWLDWDGRVVFSTVQSSSDQAPLLGSQLVHLAGLQRNNAHGLGQNIMHLLFGESIAPRVYYCMI